MTRLRLSSFCDSPDTLLNHAERSYEYILDFSFLVVSFGIIWILGIAGILEFQIYKNQQENSYYLGGNDALYQSIY